MVNCQIKPTPNQTHSFLCLLNSQVGRPELTYSSDIPDRNYLQIYQISPDTPEIPDPSLQNYLG